MLVDSNFTFKESLKRITSTLEKNIPFEIIDIEHMKLDKMQKNSNVNRGDNDSRTN